MPSVTRNLPARPFTVGKIEAGIAVLLDELDELRLVEVPADILPASARRSGAVVNLALTVNSAEHESAEQRLTGLQSSIRNLYAKTVVFRVQLKEIGTRDEKCYASFSWTPLSQTLGPFRLHSLDAYCDGTKLRIGVAADGGILLNKTLSREEGELVLTGLQEHRAYEVYLEARTDNGRYTSNVVKLRAMRGSLIGYGLCMPSSREHGDEEMEAMQLADMLGAKWISAPQHADLDYFVVAAAASPDKQAEAVDDIDHKIGEVTVEWLRALNAGMRKGE